MRCDRGIACKENAACSINALGELVGVAGGVLSDGAVNDLSLRDIAKGGEEANALLRAAADLDG